MKVALLSIDASWSFKKRLKRIEILVKKAAENGARLALLPELSYGGYSVDSSALMAYDFDVGFEFFAAVAKNYGIYIGFGVSCLQDNGKFKNSYIVVSNNGDKVCNYDKIHLFSFANEDTVFDCGDRLACFELEGVRIGLSICYDLRFAEIFSLYADSCDAVLCAAAWPKKRVDDFRLLLKARALENRMSMIGINWQGGDLYSKSSFVVDNTARIQKSFVSKGELDIYELEKTNLGSDRPNSVADKRFDLYMKLMLERL